MIMIIQAVSPMMRNEILCRDINDERRSRDGDRERKRSRSRDRERRRRSRSRLAKVL